MAYEIIIKQTGFETKKVGGDWSVIDHTFFTEKDIENLSWAQKEKLDLSSIEKLKKPVYGYTPMIEKSFFFDREIFRQTVQEMDLTKVVKAVNNI